MTGNISRHDRIYSRSKMLTRSIRKFGTVREGVPAKRTSVAVTLLKPLVETLIMELVVTSGALLVRQFPPRGRDNRVANGAFLMSLQRYGNIFAESFQAVYDRTVLEYWSVLKCDCFSSIYLTVN